MGLKGSNSITAFTLSSTYGRNSMEGKAESRKSVALFSTAFPPAFPAWQNPLQVPFFKRVAGKRKRETVFTLPNESPESHSTMGERHLVESLLKCGAVRSDGMECHPNAQQHVPLKEIVDTHRVVETVRNGPEHNGSARKRRRAAVLRSWTAMKFC